MAGRICVVTEGGSGIGCAVAQVFAREQARVAILGWDLRCAEETAALLPADQAMAISKASYENPDVLRGRSWAVPLERVGRPEEIAESVLFLASPRASYVNGAELRVDGGLKQNFMSLIPHN